MMEATVAIAGTVAAVKLIEKISDAAGWVAAPYQIERMAEREARAAKIRAESAIEVEDIKRTRNIGDASDISMPTEAEIVDFIKRTGNRVAIEEARRQVIMENIIMKSLRHLQDDTASPERIENDWIVNFLQRCRNVSDEDMQERWARLLASEANNPGHFSRKAVNIFDDLDARAAKDFETYCRFICQVGAILRPFIILNDGVGLDDIYTEAGFDFNAMVRLSSLGLIETGFGPGVPMSVNPVLADVPERVPFRYYDKSVELPGPEGGTMTTGCAVLSVAGEQLATLCLPAEPVEGFFEFVCNKWHTLHKKATLSQGGTAMSYLDSVPV